MGNSGMSIPIGPSSRTTRVSHTRAGRPVKTLVITVCSGGVERAASRYRGEPGLLTPPVPCGRLMAKKVQVERPRRAPPYFADDATGLFRIESGRRKRAEPACFGNSNDHVGCHHAEHRSLDDRQINSEQVEYGSRINAQRSLPYPDTRRSLRRSPTTGVGAAIDVQYLPGHEGCIVEIEDRVDDILNFSNAPDRVHRR